MLSYFLHLMHEQGRYVCTLFAFALNDFQMMVTGRQKLLTILFMVFLGTILIYKARVYGPEKVNNFKTTFGIGR